MKKSLRVAASFFVLGTLLTSPLHAMEEEKENRCTGANPHQIRKKHNKGSRITSRLFLEERSGFNLNDILKEQGSENAFHDFKRNEKAFHDLEESFKNNQILKKQKNEKAVHNLEQSFEKLRLLFQEVPDTNGPSIPQLQETIQGNKGNGVKTNLIRRAPKKSGVNTTLFPAKHEVNTEIIQERPEIKIIQEIPEVNPRLARVLRDIEMLHPAINAQNLLTNLRAALSATSPLNEHPKATHIVDSLIDGLKDPEDLQDIFTRLAKKNGYDLSDDFTYEECITSFRDAMLEDYLDFSCDESSSESYDESSSESI